MAKEYSPMCPTIYEQLLAEQKNGNPFLTISEPHAVLGVRFNPVEYMEKRGYFPKNFDIKFDSEFNYCISPYSSIPCYSEPTKDKQEWKENYCNTVLFSFPMNYL
ncbi:hypothetical protein [Phocoenobacter skyensis]|uniref:hypothetical protein n=1 Tax=Phocoenobacter skyensis TaxID=97481 RepID=UPI00276FF28A|nr:hypothetical protein [Pasteurella skyensis]MDP8185291.1 hypothetical protein [Pasteurella skyensis]